MKSGKETYKNNSLCPQSLAVYEASGDIIGRLPGLG